MGFVERARVGKNLVRSAAFIGAYAAHAALGKLTIRERNARLRFFTKNVGRYTERVLRLFNTKIEVFGLDRERMARRNFLIVSNHLSYLDILVLSSVQPCVFVTSVDLGETGFLGTMAELGGSIFVERRNRARVARDMTMMAETLRAGHHVVIFPEGTSTDGTQLLPFKKSLLMSAVEAGVDILPVAIKYVEVNGEPITDANRGKLAWYGDTAFFDHFMGVMDVKSVKIELHFLDPIPVTKESSRHDLADQAYRAIYQAYFGKPAST